MTIEGRRRGAQRSCQIRRRAGGHCAVVAHPPPHQKRTAEKRKFIDTSICQIKPKYIHILNQYTRVRPAQPLLKDISETSLFDTLDVWDARLAFWRWCDQDARLLHRPPSPSRGRPRGISGKRSAGLEYQSPPGATRRAHPRDRQVLDDCPPGRTSAAVTARPTGRSRSPLMATARGCSGRRGSSVLRARPQDGRVRNHPGDDRRISVVLPPT
ncbi:MAG: hypothetical protein ACLVL7_09510 [Anaerotruncus massiliensis (ex Togo et al. 2019)]